MTLPERCDVVVVGAGPAGLAAAVECARAGAATVILDEQAGPGGQIYRAITSTPMQKRELLGADYWHGATLVAALQGSGATYVPRAAAFAVSRADGGGFEVGVASGGAAALIRAGQVILATGALERPFPIPGWTLPGVIAAGAAQILLKTAGLVPEGPVVLAGTGPLLYLVAAQFARVGAAIDCLLDTTPPGRIRDAWPHAGAFLASPYAAKGFALLRQARASTRIVRGVERLEALGAQRLASVRYTVGGRATEIPAAALLLHQGVVPDINLSNAIGCDHRWHAARSCFEPVVDVYGATSAAGITVAGDGAGIAGAQAAEARGTLAGLHALAALGRIDAGERDNRAAEAKARVARWTRGRAFVDALYRPPDAFRMPLGDTVVCRCEEITAEQVIATARLGCPGPNQMKSFLRCGMGPCQGRLCGLTVTEMIARERGVSPAEVGYYRLRFPVKPITLGELASLPQTTASTQAVVRMKAH